MDIFVGTLNFNAGEDTFIQMKKSLRCRGKFLDLSTPAIMAILNVTPDSFYDGGKINDKNSILTVAEAMLKEGADILDIGGQSTRPGASRISEIEEWDRIAPALIQIHKNFPDTIISVDTFYSEVAKKAIDEGASIVNDISAGEFDAKMFPFICASQTPYVMLHMQGSPENMQKNPQYDNVVLEVLNFFIKKVSHLRKMGLHDIIIDPGFGFGKNINHNYSLLKNLNHFQILNCPIMAGISSKSMVTKTLNVLPEDSLNGTTVLNSLALINGASILRVHDVKEAAEIKKIFLEYKKSN